MTPCTLLGHAFISTLAMSSTCRGWLFISFLMRVLWGPPELRTSALDSWRAVLMKVDALMKVSRSVLLL